jgi:hypothetical protein
LSHQTLASRILLLFCCDHLRGCAPRLARTHRQFADQ